MTLKDKIEFMRTLLELRVQTNHDNMILHNMDILLEHHSPDNLFGEFVEWDDLAIAEAGKSLALLKVKDWYRKAIECMEQEKPIPIPPLG